MQSAKDSGSDLYVLLRLRMTRMNRPQANQISMLALFSILTICCFLFDYVKFVGWNSLLYSLGPPCLIAILLRSIFCWCAMYLDHSDVVTRVSNEDQAELIRLLIALIIGLAIWIPAMIAFPYYDEVPLK